MINQNYFSISLLLKKCIARYSRRIDILNIQNKISIFKQNLPYKKLPYSKRNWGHGLHSLCSYQGKLKPAIAYWLVNLFSEPGQVVLDPLGGVGTIAFEACLQGRYGISNDLSPFAATVAAAKIDLPSVEEVTNYLKMFEKDLEKIVLTKNDIAAADFGLNAKIKDYFHQDTLAEVLKARKFFLSSWGWSKAETFVRANILHILHGNRPYALSRNSHSITPFNPTGVFEYRSLIGKLRERIDRIMALPLPEGFLRGQSYSKNFSGLSEVVHEVDVIITSPPFVRMRFDRPNWLRLWFCGWCEEDFHKKSLQFIDRIQVKNWDIYHTFFEINSNILKCSGLLIIHLGGSPKYDMLKELVSRTKQHNFEIIDIVSEDVSDVGNHGLKDKGITNIHQFLFLNKK